MYILTQKNYRNEDIAAKLALALCRGSTTCALMVKTNFTSIIKDCMGQKQAKNDAKQFASKTVALMIEDAKNILKSAKDIADESGIDFAIEDLYSEVSGNYNVDWYSSHCEGYSY